MTCRFPASSSCYSAFALAAVLLMPGMAMAGSDTLGLGAIIQPIVDNLLLIAGILIVAAIIVVGLSYAFGEAGGLFRPALRVVVGGFIALSAVAIADTLFGGAAGFIL